ncbi:MAG: 2-oxoacid:acceptor oxidoreductase family protein, partial [Planctomycetota bacterium]
MTPPAPNERRSILLAGVGGQGVLTAAQIIGRAALAAGLDGMVGQLHGMSQRGGSVEASVVIGAGKSAFIRDRGADAVLGFEPLEALRVSPRVAPHARVVVNTGRIVPFSIVKGGGEYPPLGEILERLGAAAGSVRTIDG